MRWLIPAPFGLLFVITSYLIAVVFGITGIVHAGRIGGNRATSITGLVIGALVLIVGVFVVIVLISVTMAGISAPIR